MKRIGSLLVAALAVAGVLLPATAAQADPRRHHRHGVVRGEVARPAPARPPARGVARNGALPTAAPAKRAADEVALRPLVIGLDAADFGLPTWKAVLNRVGSPYDVLLAKDERLTAERLVRPDGVGRYNAILLTDNALLHLSGGQYVSGFDDVEWQVLWNYEATHKVRQVSLFTSWGTFPEDYCLRPGAEDSAKKYTAALTGAGGKLFDYLKTDASIPITDSYVYRSTLAPNCAAEPLLTIGQYVVGVTSTAADGRERAALTFTSDQNLAQTDLLGYGLLRWATRGVLVGEFRHWVNVDVDDWFNYTDHLYPDGHLETEPGFRASGTDAAAADAQQRKLRADYPLAAGFTLNLPYNGDGIDGEAPSQCSNEDTPDPLTSYSRCLSKNFRWLNHTVTHPELNFTDYDESYEEIAENLEIGRDTGLTVPTNVLKTPAYSGLGVYNPDPDAPDTDPPTDFGLAKSNKELLEAAKDAGVRYLHGNMSFPSHQPNCFNCGIRHPLRPELLVVPDWPTNIGYHTTAAAEQTLFYNSFYGPKGKFPFHDHDLNYTEMVDYEAEVALQHVMSGSAYAHTLHQGNLREYATGRSLTSDWLRAVVAKYSARYQVPLLNPDWPTLAKYVDARTAHFAELNAKRDPVWNKAKNTVTYTPGTTGSLFLTGVTSSSGETQGYGSDRVTRVPITAGKQVVATAVPRR
ncbi:Agd3-related carbohydrate-binding protein [Saccharothrix obliqua]|uniref:Agd3-related carbohydrate-binding protein n=1 Tax=Saccharothrix obliqua TaxID=2861747 RepID=UPI0027E2CAF4|nr:hypothetical protein [Saccharothrix obliqua]